MAPIALFALSGLIILFLPITKALELKQKKTFFIFNLISKGDIYAREFYHQGVHFYSEGKEQILFFFQRQVPIHAKNSLNKLSAFVSEKREQYFINMRNSRLLKKPDGISEFFKNMSEIEKGNGEINDVYEDQSQMSHLSDLN